MAIERNIAFGVGDVPIERIEQAAKNAEVHENIIDFLRDIIPEWAKGELP